MPAKTKFTESFVRSISINWKKQYQELLQLEKDIDTLEAQRKRIIEQLRFFFDVYQMHGGKELKLTTEQQIRITDDTSIADAVEILLREYHALTRTEIREKLQSFGRLKTPNARIVVANAIARDERFIEKEGKIQLREK
ncbi:MAG: hypothetical protein L0Y80_04450 [Ignavibacteriae bacterium]|nr:hypothetical protein [Ignavibacteriota bacterium]